LSQVSRQTQWQVRYEHEQSEFVLRTTAGHKLVFTLYNNFYVCDMATSIFRSHRARVKDAVELFTNSYRTCPTWLLTARLEKIKDTARVLEVMNTDFPQLENRHDMLQNREWCNEHINVLEDAILHRVSTHGDTSNHTDLSSDVLIPRHSEDEIYDLKIREIRDEYFRDLDAGMSEQHASAKKISAEKTALKCYKPTAAAETRDWRPPLRFRTILASTFRKNGSFPEPTTTHADTSSSSNDAAGRPLKRRAVQPTRNFRAMPHGSPSVVEGNTSFEPNSPDSPPSASAGAELAAQALSSLGNSGVQIGSRSNSGRINDERRVDGGQNEAGAAEGGRIEPSRIEAARIEAFRVRGGRSQGGRSHGGRNRRSRSEPSRTETSREDGQEHNFVKFVALGTRLVNADVMQPSMKYAFASTVSENLKSYNSHQRKKIAEAMKLAEKLAYPSAGKAIEFVNSGSMNDVPITAQDIARAYEAYGTPIPLLQGKTVHKSEHPYVPERLPRTISTTLQLHADLMFIEEIAFLISVSKPMDLVIVTPLGKGIGTKSETSLRQALIGQYHVYWAKGFEISAVIMDGESAARKIAELVNVPPMVTLASGVHNVVVEARIRRIKEGVRSILSGLPFKVSKVILIWAVLYVTYVTNLMPKSSGYKGSGVCPRQDLTNIRPVFSRDLPFAFGQFVQAAQGVSDNSMKARTFSAITLLPTGNSNGSVKVMNLSTGRVCIRSKRQLTPLPMPTEWINILNIWAHASNGRDTPGHWEYKGYYLDEEDETNHDDTLMKVVTSYLSPTRTLAPTEPVTELSMPKAFKPILEEVENETGADLGFNSADDTFDGLETADSIQAGVETADTDNDVPYETPELDSRHEPHLTNIVKVYNLSLTEAINTRGADVAKDAALKELNQLIEKGCLMPVDKLTVQKLKEDKQLILPSKLFLKDKYRPDGAFDKFKARLVAGGHRQNHHDYESTSSPTVATSSVLIVAALSAKCGNARMTTDVPSAYPNAHMREDMPMVYMKLDRAVTKLIADNHPGWRRHVLSDGCCVVKIERALYGLIESAKLWYEEFTGFLKGLGFIPNPYDPCVLNLNYKGERCTLVLYVDDCFVDCHDPAALDYIEKKITEKYGGCTRTDGNVLPFVGMLFDFTQPGVVRVDMPKYVEDAISGLESATPAETPAALDLFAVDESAELLATSAKEDFHSRVAKLLYLAKRTRPDILLPVNFLCTRVLIPTVQDWKKLMRVYKYLLGTKGLCIYLQADDDNCVKGYYDASYGVHTDMKSHTGACTTLGRGAVYVTSSKQTIVAKSSTEAEMIAVSDHAGELIAQNEFYVHQCGLNKPAILYQDNQSTMKLLKNGKSSSDRTKHIKIRYFWLKERVDLKDILVEYMPTEDMIADLLTKPLQGDLFIKLRRFLMNLQN